MKLPIQEISIDLAINRRTPILSDRDNLLQANGISLQQQLEKQTKIWQAKKIFSQSNYRIFIRENKIIFSKPTNRHHFKDKGLEIPQIIISYTNFLSYLNYQKISFNFNSYINFNSQKKLQNFLDRSILASSFWHNCLTEKSTTLNMKIGFPYEDVTFIFELEKTNFYDNNSNYYIIWFTGKFDYCLKEMSHQDKILAIQKKVDNYALYSDRFQDFIGERFGV